MPVGKPLNILVVEDSASDAELIVRQIKLAGYGVHWKQVADDAAMKSALAQQDWDAILSDYEMLGFSGSDALVIARASGCEAPFIFVSGCMGEDLAVEAMRAGARDYIRKDNLLRLVPSIERELREAEQQIERRQTETNLREIEVRYRSLFENMLNGFAYCRMIFENGKPQDFVYLAVNRAFESLTGLKNVVGRKVSEVIPGIREADSNLFEVYGRVARSGIPEKLETYVEAMQTWFSIALYSPGKDHFVAVFDVITERKQAESALLESRAKLAAALASMTDAVFISDASGQFIEFNEAFATFHRFKSKAECGNLFSYYRDIFDLFLPNGDPVPPEMRMVSRALRGETVTNAEYTLRRKDSGETWIGSYCFSPIRDKNGAIVGSVVVARDITESKRAEAVIKENEERFRTMFEMASIGMAQADPHTGRWLRVNKKMCMITGYSEQEMLKARVPDITHPEDRERDWTAFQRVVAGKDTDYRIEKRYVRKDGSVVWVSVNMTLFRDAEGNPVHTMATIEDITERKASELQLRQLSQAVKQSPDAIVITDTGGAIQYVNPKFTAITGYSFEEALGKNPRILKTGETPPETYKDLWDTIKAGREWRGEFHNRKKNGELFWESASISPITDKNGAITNFLAVKEDITEHKQLTEQFLRAQRLENIGTLASGIAHDLNNILAPIMMASNMLEDDLPQETRHRLARSIYEAAQRGSDIVKQVLTFARGVEGNRVALRPELLIAQVGRILRETFPKAIAFTESIPEDLWAVSGDATQLHQVLLNLCVNARDAMMHDGGTLAITASNVEIDENYAVMSIDAKPGRYVVMKVIDSGCGMPASYIQKIFDPFFTTKEAGQGTGLGLSTVMGIVKSHKGFMEVESKEGRGSVFRVYIPAAPERQLVADQTVLAVAPRGNGETVLLIDDESEILNVAGLTLKQNGYEVLTAADGIEALTAYVKNSELIRVVVTDVMMPMMDGVNLTRALKRLNPEVRIIAASGHSEESRHNELRALGIHALLDKPFNNYQLLEALHSAINKPAERNYPRGAC